MAIEPQVAKQIEQFVAQQEIKATTQRLERVYAHLQTLIARSIKPSLGDA